MDILSVFVQIVTNFFVVIGIVAVSIVALKIVFDWSDRRMIRKIRNRRRSRQW